MENEFGKLIEKLIHLSGQKNYSLAMELGYDVSYISKWINSSMFPSSKNIKTINNNIAKFIVKSSEEENINNLYNYFALEKEHDSDYKVLIKKIENKLFEGYLYSQEKYNKKRCSNKQDETNSIQTINASLRKRYLNEVVSKYANELEEINMIAICNLLSLKLEDKIKISGLNQLKNNNVNQKKYNINMKYLLNFDNKLESMPSDTVMIIKMITSVNRNNVSFYSCDFAPGTLIVAIKNICTHTGIFDKDQCLITVESNDQEVVKELYESLENIVDTKSTPMFKNKSPKDMVLGKEYINHIMEEDLNYIMGHITELFMPSDLFLEIGKEIFGDEEEIVSSLNKIDTIIKGMIYDSDMKIILYESVLKEYIENGNMKFFNKEFKMNLEQRKKHVKYMQNLFDEKDNININLVKNIATSNDEERISLYMSYDSILLLEESNGIRSDYLIVKDLNLNNILRDFFKNAWKEENAKTDKVKAKKLMTNSLKYIDILQNV